MSNGLKDHEIARIVNAVRYELVKAYSPGIRFPDSLREVVRVAVVDTLVDMGLKIDK